MGIWGHVVPKYHREIFGNDEPHSLYFILMKLMDFWEMHPLRPEFTTIFQIVPKEKQDEFKQRYIKHIPIEGLEAIAPGCHFIPGFHRSAKLVPYLERDKEIRVPPVVFFGIDLKNEQWKSGYIYEGKHRVGAAAVLKWSTVPALVLHTVGELEGVGYCGMTVDEREEMYKEQMKRGLPNSSRIHGMQIILWSEEELRTFMRPRSHNKSKYYMQGDKLVITGYKLNNHPDWEGVPKGIVISHKGKEIARPWQLTGPPKK